MVTDTGQGHGSQSKTCKQIQNSCGKKKQVRKSKYTRNKRKARNKTRRNIGWIDKDRGNHRLLYRKKGKFMATTWNSSVLGRQSQQREKDRSMKWQKMHKERITKQNRKYKPETLIYSTESSKQTRINCKFRIITWEPTWPILNSNSKSPTVFKCKRSRKKDVAHNIWFWMEFNRGSIR